jgi:phosphoribosylanthranilate isomerase
MKVQIKVCGMRDSANIQEVAGLKPDYLGFIFYDQSPRYVGTEFKMPDFRKKTKRVGVFVNHPVEFIFRQLEQYTLDAVQLHGDEQAEVCARIKSRGITVIKSFPVDSDFDFSRTLEYQYKADFFLFDTKGKSYGGTGQAFDWNHLKKYSSPTPFFLSGGLSEENISKLAAIQNPSLYAVDLNSGVEDSPGMKNKSKLEKVIKLLNEIK